MGRQSFGKPYGMLEAGSDAPGLISTSTQSLHYFAPVSQMPHLDLLLDKNPIKRIGPPSFMWATIQAFERLGARQAAPTQEKLTRQSEWLDKFIELKKEYPDTVDDQMVIQYLLANILAGSDTTAILMTSAVYYLSLIHI